MRGIQHVCCVGRITVEWTPQDALLQGQFLLTFASIEMAVAPQSAEMRVTSSRVMNRVSSGRQGSRVSPGCKMKRGTKHRLLFLRRSPLKFKRLFYRTSDNLSGIFPDLSLSMAHGTVDSSPRRVPYLLITQRTLHYHPPYGMVSRIQVTVQYKTYTVCVMMRINMEKGSV